jgi:hypothetical protein
MLIPGISLLFRRPSRCAAADARTGSASGRFQLQHSNFGFSASRPASNGLALLPETVSPLCFERCL